MRVVQSIPVDYFVSFTFKGFHLLDNKTTERAEMICGNVFSGLRSLNTAKTGAERSD